MSPRLVRRLRLAPLAGVAAAFLLGACQLPVALGGFGVLAGLGGPDAPADGSGKPDPAASGGPSGPVGSPNIPVETTGGGLVKGGATLGGKVRLDGRGTAEGVKVHLQGDGGHSATILTDTTGVFRFENIAAGQYQLKITKDGYTSIDRPGVAVPSDPLDFTLVSPILRVDLKAAGDTIYPPPPADKFNLTSQPPRLQVTATIVRSNGDSIAGTRDNLAFSVEPADQAVLGADLVLATTDRAVPGSVTITAKTVDGAIERKLTVPVGDPKAHAGITVVSLRGAR
ncbi:MAG: carboxypeptidase regulatory-like domain-containing protein [Candidatus Sericytochromatia bacterium]|nr:carboxypeptidase regulatory-like domain-containing protein [Candidatus Tanganyikabacteria bacterium]